MEAEPGPGCSPESLLRVLSRSLTNQPRPPLRFLMSSSPYQIPAFHPRPETWRVLCYIDNTGGRGRAWTGGTRYGQQTDSVHGEDETLPPGRPGHRRCSSPNSEPAASTQCRSACSWLPHPGRLLLATLTCLRATRWK